MDIFMLKNMISIKDMYDFDWFNQIYTIRNVWLHKVNIMIMKIYKLWRNVHKLYYYSHIVVFIYIILFPYNCIYLYYSYVNEENLYNFCIIPVLL